MKDAGYYQAHKDDDDEWGEAERPPAAPSRRLSSMISVRFGPDEAVALRAAAAEAGESVSNFVREATLRRLPHPAASGMTATGTGTPPFVGPAGATRTGHGPKMSPVDRGTFASGPPRLRPITRRKPA